MTKPQKDIEITELLKELERAEQPLAHHAADTIRAMQARLLLVEAHLVLAENALERRQTTVQGLKGV